jgi:hypothetical protein
LEETAEVVGAKPAGRGPEVGFGRGAEDLGGEDVADLSPENDPPAPHPVLGEAGDDADGDVDTGGQKRGEIPLDARRRVLDDLPGRLQGHQGCVAKVL